MIAKDFSLTLNLDKKDFDEVLDSFIELEEDIRKESK